jgi:hypothetical protein
MNQTFKKKTTERLEDNHKNKSSEPLRGRNFLSTEAMEMSQRNVLNYTCGSFNISRYYIIKNSTKT